AILVSRVAIRFRGNVATAAVAAQHSGLYVFPAQFSDLLDVREHNLPLRVTNVDAKAALQLEAGAHTIDFKRRWWRPGLAISAMGCLAAVVVFAYRRRTPRRRA